MTRRRGYEELERKIKNLEHGAHLCCIYQSQEEHQAVLTPFLRQGLKRDEKVLYITDTLTAAEVLSYLRQDGLAPEPYLKSGQLAIVTTDESYTRQKYFDPDGMISLLKEETKRALEEGYSALRVTGEMTWALSGLAGSERIVEYEAKLNDFFPDSKCLAICQYDRRRFEPGVLLDVLATHPIAIIGTEIFENFYYMPPEDFLGPDPAMARLNNRLKNLAERKQAEEALRKAHDELERRVQERTAELVESNRRLKLEIEEHKRTEEALRNSEKRFRDLVENTLTCISIVQDGHIVYQNPEHQKLLGVPTDSPIPVNLETVHPDDSEKVKDTYQKMLSGETLTADIDFRFYPPGKKNSRTGLKWVYCRTSLIEYRGKPALLVTLMDVTRAKELERLLYIEDKMTSLGHVAAGIAHEIRNPLSGINIYLNALEKIREEPDYAEKTKEVLGKLQSASNKIESVINRVVDFSKPSEPRFTMTDVNQPIKEAIDLASVTLRKGGIAIEKALAEDLPSCRADPRLIEQVILNLTTNAAEAMEGMDRAKKIEITSSVKKSRLLVTVSDSGPGVPLNLKEKIFDAFYTTKNGSTGLGLSLSHRIITDRGGSLRVGTSVLGGAELIIEIPVEEGTK